MDIKDAHVHDIHVFGLERVYYDLSKSGAQLYCQQPQRRLIFIPVVEDGERTREQFRTLCVCVWGGGGGG